MRAFEKRIHNDKFWQDQSAPQKKHIFFVHQRDTHGNVVKTCFEDKSDIASETVFRQEIFFLSRLKGKLV